jgi:mannose-1-phosphate guanylyltransferase
MNSNLYAVIMAGGVGSRFWPVSTPAYPKQFHDMLGTGQTLLQRTFSRLTQLIPASQIYVLTNESYKALVLSQLPEISSVQLVLEPLMRNTAPCILYAALKIKKINPAAQMLVAPSDHWIEDEAVFIKNVQEAFDFSKRHKVLMTLGILPTFPNTGYGYIEYDSKETHEVKKVVQFREKPDYETAKSFLSQGNFLWNAGIFLWDVDTILSSFETHQSEMYMLLNQGDAVFNTENEHAFIANQFPKLANISIDYAILEKASNVFVLPVHFDWNDLGTWGSLYEKLPKDLNDNAVVNAQLIADDASGNIISTAKHKKVVIKGLNNYIVVDKDEFLLILPIIDEQKIKEISQKTF